MFDNKAKNETKVMGDIKNIVSFIYSVIQEYASSNNCSSGVLDYLENEEGKQGLFKNFTECKGVPKNGLKKVEHNLARGMTQFSKKFPPVQDGLHLDRFLPDYDTKELSENHLGCKSWKNTKIGV